MSRTLGRALVIGSAACRAHVRGALGTAPYEVSGCDDPYSAAIELLRRPLAYRIAILCLNSTYREELAMIAMIRRRLRHIDVYVAQSNGRDAALAEALRLGAVGLLAEDGLHRIADHAAPPAQPVTDDATPRESDPPAATVASTSLDPSDASDEELPSGEAVLTTEELRALLMEQPSLPPSGTES